VPQIVISRFLSNERDIRLATADKLANALGLKLKVSTHAETSIPRRLCLSRNQCLASFSGMFARKRCQMAPHDSFARSAQPGIYLFEALGQNTQVAIEVRLATLRRSTESANTRSVTGAWRLLLDCPNESVLLVPQLTIVTPPKPKFYYFVACLPIVPSSWQGV